jgi:hypothetical protein
MDLHRRLRGQPHARAAPDADALLEAVVAERAGSRQGKDHVQAVALGEPSPDAEGWLGVSLGQHGTAVAVEKGEIEPGVPADERERALVATTNPSPRNLGLRGYALIVSA